MIISVGNNYTRKKICDEKNIQYHTPIHPATILSVHSSVGEGSVVMRGALINTDTFIGKHCIVTAMPPLIMIVLSEILFRYHRMTRFTEVLPLEIATPYNHYFQKK